MHWVAATTKPCAILAAGNVRARKDRLAAAIRRADEVRLDSPRGRRRRFSCLLNALRQLGLHFFQHASGCSYEVLQPSMLFRMVYMRQSVELWRRVRRWVSSGLKLSGLLRPLAVPRGATGLESTRKVVPLTIENLVLHCGARLLLDAHLSGPEARPLACELLVLSLQDSKVAMRRLWPHAPTMTASSCGDTSLVTG